MITLTAPAITNTISAIPNPKGTKKQPLASNRCCVAAAPVFNESQNSQSVPVPDWDINDNRIPLVSIHDQFQEWADGHCKYVFTVNNEQAKRHSSGWAMRNTNNHNIYILKKSCLGVIVCSEKCNIPSIGMLRLRPAICDKARKKQQQKTCPNPKCNGRLQIVNCRGHCGYPVTHFWRHTEHTIFFQAKGVHDHPKPETKITLETRKHLSAGTLKIPNGGGRERRKLQGTRKKRTKLLQPLEARLGLGHEFSGLPFQPNEPTKKKPSSRTTVKRRKDKSPAAAIASHSSLPLSFDPFTSNFGSKKNQSSQKLSLTSKYEYLKPKYLTQSATAMINPNDPGRISDYSEPSCKENGMQLFGNTYSKETFSWPNNVSSSSGFDCSASMQQFGYPCESLDKKFGVYEQNYGTNINNNNNNEWHSSSGYYGSSSDYNNDTFRPSDIFLLEPATSVSASGAGDSDSSLASYNQCQYGQFCYSGNGVADCSLGLGQTHLGFNSSSNNMQPQAEVTPAALSASSQAPNNYSCYKSVTFGTEEPICIHPTETISNCLQSDGLYEKESGQAHEHWSAAACNFQQRPVINKSLYPNHHHHHLHIPHQQEFILPDQYPGSVLINDNVNQSNSHTVNQFTSSSIDSTEAWAHPNSLMYNNYGKECANI